MENARVMLEISCHPLMPSTDPKRDPSMPEVVAAKGLEGAFDTAPENVADREKWQILTHELVQKQDIVHRLMRENDDKTSSLKLATAEIVDLRRGMKMLQSEMQILKRQLGDQEAAQLSSVVAKEIGGMSNEELKSKIIKLAQAYRTERLRNEEFSKALKSANVDLAQAKTISTEFDTL